MFPELWRQDHGQTPFSHPYLTLPQLGTSVAQMWPEPPLSTSCRIRASFPGPASKVLLTCMPPSESCPLTSGCPGLTEPLPYGLVVLHLMLSRPALCLGCSRSSLACLMGFYSSLVALQGPSCYPLHRGLPLCRVDFSLGEWSACGRDHVVEGQTGHSGILDTPEARWQGCSFACRPFTFEDGGVCGRMYRLVQP